MAMEENKNGKQELDETEEENNQNNEGGTNGSTDEGSEGGSNDGGNSGEGSGNGGNGEETKSYTQKQLNKMMAREKNQGRAAAFRELGIDPKDKKTIALLQSVMKGNGGGQQSEGANDQQLAEANKRALVAEIKAEAMKQGIQPNFVDDIVTLVMNKMEADEDSDMSTLIGEFKAKYPSWAEKTTEEESKKKESAGQRGTGSSTKGNSAKGGKEEESGNLGKRLAAQRKGHNPSKKSFWS